MKFRIQYSKLLHFFGYFQHTASCAIVGKLSSVYYIFAQIRMYH